MSLQEQLDAFLVQTRAKRPPEWQVIIDRTVEHLRRSGIVGRSLKAGHRAPEFALPNGTGHIVRSADLLTQGHLVVSFYRGGW
jgi:hypothetical protein